MVSHGLTPTAVTAVTEEVEDITQYHQPPNTIRREVHALPGDSEKDSCSCSKLAHKQYFPSIKLEKAHVPPQTCITLKLSGYGAKTAATSSMVFVTFSFPGLEDNVLSAAGILDKTLHVRVSRCNLHECTDTYMYLLYFAWVN